MLNGLYFHDTAYLEYDLTIDCFYTMTQQHVLPLLLFLLLLLYVFVPSYLGCAGGACNAGRNGGPPMRIVGEV